MPYEKLVVWNNVVTYRHNFHSIALQTWTCCHFLHNQSLILWAGVSKVRDDHSFLELTYLMQNHCMQVTINDFFNTNFSISNYLFGIILMISYHIYHSGHSKEALFKQILFSQSMTSQRYILPFFFALKELELHSLGR